MLGNVIVGQSGGPTSVINSSLAGVFKTAKDRGANKVYGMLHGIKGLLDEQYVDLSEKIKTDIDIDLLKRTPSSYLGSCRYKLPEISDVYKRQHTHHRLCSQTAYARHIMLKVIRCYYIFIRL